MRKILCTLCCVLLFACTMLCACTTTAQPTEKYDVVATIFPAYDFVRAIAGDELKIKDRYKNIKDF